MSGVTLSLPPGVRASRPQQYVSFLNNPKISILTASDPTDTVHVAVHDLELSWATAGWELRMPLSEITGARVSPGSFGDYDFICFVLAFGPDGGGVALLTGPLDTKQWFQEAAQVISPLLSGGVQWMLPPVVA
jgi:hypothetical protein